MPVRTKQNIALNPPSAANGRRDFGLLLAARVLRAFGFGFSAILIAVYLQARNLSPTQIGVVLAVGLLAGSLAGLLSAAAGGRFGRRKTLAVVGLMMTLCGVDLAFAQQPWLLTLSGLTGMMGVGGSDLGPFLAIEQTVLTQTSDAAGRNRAFAGYAFTGSLAGAAGAFAAAGATSLARTQALFVVFATIGLITAVIPLMLSADVEGQPHVKVFGSFRPLVGLSAIFAVDSLGGGLVVSGLVAYWLHIKFGATASVLGPTFGSMSILAALSQAFAGRLADRFGLINTMVFTHLPSNLLLVLVPFMPNLAWAVGLLVLRSTIASMDQPPRQAYIVSIVKSHERSGAIAVTGAARGIAQAAGPLITGIAMQTAGLGIPFILGGLIKTCSDLGLYVGFRRRFGPTENEALAIAAQVSTR